MRTYCLETRMTALSSISHNGGQIYGINAKLRREKFVQCDGSVEEVPVLSGNGMRGLLRDRGMLHMCRTLGYGVDDEAGQVRGLSLQAFYFLFSGGTLSSDGGKSFDLAKARELRALIPLVGVFGGAVGNLIMPGKLKMGKAIPLCSETTHLLPERFASQQSIWSFLQEEMYVRKDDEKHELLRTVIEPATRARIEAAKVEKSAKTKAAKTALDTVEAVGEPGAAQQMQYYVETFAAGTPFYLKIVLDDVTEVEFEAFLITLVEFSRRPYVGGKSAVGLGEVSLECADWFRIDSRLQAEQAALTAPAGAAYLNHLTENAGRIRDILGAM